MDQGVSSKAADAVAEAAAPGATAVEQGASHAVDRWLVHRIGAALGACRLRVELWDGWSQSFSPDPRATLVVKSRSALVGLVVNPDLYMGEAFGDGRVEVQGSLVAFLEELYGALEAAGRRRRGLLSLFDWNTIRGARDNVHRHYDLGNDFYRLWLDPELVYTCAYYPTPRTSLGDAQRAKLELVCRKLDLKPGERVVEAGCGWGALALHMARSRGVFVKAFNISKEQLAVCRERARAQGLDHRVEFIDGDYRDIDVEADAFVSVGMLEHVGSASYPTLGRVIDRCLPKRRGRGLLHFIGRNYPRPLNAWIRRRIFPGAYAPALSEVLDAILEPANLAVLDVENLGLHYARTLEAWGENFERAAGNVAARFGESFVRTWRLYLAGSTAAFTTGSMQLFQVVFERPGAQSGPWTRREWYRGADGLV
jgi:cyclopropane-fatty-acyl-phospholipid synthase